MAINKDFREKNKLLVFQISVASPIHKLAHINKYKICVHNTATDTRKRLRNQDKWMN